MAKTIDTYANMSYGGKPVQDPRKLYSEYLRIVQESPNTWPGISTEFWGKANSYICPRGMYAGRAWLLMLRSDIEALDVNYPHEFEIATAQGRFKTRLGIIRATCMTPGSPEDGNGNYLVELGDRRYPLEKWHNISGGSPVPAANLRRLNQYTLSHDGTDPTDEYHTSSLTSGTTLKTWSTAIQHIWDSNLVLARFLGSPFPGLPYTPAGHPENINFMIGGGRWANMHYLLDLINCDTVYSPFDTDTGDDADDLGGVSAAWRFAGKATIVRLGEVQETLETVIDMARSSGTLLFDTELIESDWGKYPAGYTTSFPYRYYRQPFDAPLRKDATFPFPFTYYTKFLAIAAVDSSLASTDLPQLATGTNYEGELALLSDVSSSTSSPLNQTALDARATEITTNKHNRLKHSESPFRYVISGHVDINPGSQVKAVIWGDLGDGYMTQVLGFAGRANQIFGTGRSPRGIVDLPVYESADVFSAGQQHSAHLSGVRRQYEEYPETALIYVAAATMPSANGVYDGKIVCVKSGGNLLAPGVPGSTNIAEVSATSTCYLAMFPPPVRGTANTAGKAYARYYLGRFAGLQDEGGGNVRPLYIADMGTMGSPAFASASYSGGVWTAGQSINIGQSSGTWTVHHPGNYVAMANYDTTGAISGSLGSSQTIQSPMIAGKLTAGQTVTFGTPASSGNFCLFKVNHED